MTTIAPATDLDRQILALDGEPAVARIPAPDGPRYLTGTVTVQEATLPGLDGLPYAFRAANCNYVLEFDGPHLARIERSADSLPILHFLPRS